MFSLLSALMSNTFTAFGDVFTDVWGWGGGR
jgi:hypothetical protein